VWAIVSFMGFVPSRDKARIGETVTIDSSGLILWIRLDQHWSKKERRLNANDSVLNTAEKKMT